MPFLKPTAPSDVIRHNLYLFKMSPFLTDFNQNHPPKAEKYTVPDRLLRLEKPPFES